MAPRQLALSVQSRRVPQPWKNGKGVCYDVLAAEDPENEAWWELSTADLTEDAPFSHFPGISRQFCVARGSVELTVDGVDHICEQSSVTSFDGAAVTSCRLVACPSMALNLMQRPGSDRRIEVVVAEANAIELPDPSSQ